MNLAQIAQTTAGFTGADLENLLNEAAIMAARSGRSYITQPDIKHAFIKVGIGAEKRSKVISEKEKKITAYHEAGHAILFHVLPDMDPVYTISIIPTGMGAAGYTMPLPENDEMFNTKGKMLQDITTLLGGRVAEEIIFGDITTGASNDIKRATSTARAMVMQYGMSDKLGLITYGDDGMKSLSAVIWLIQEATVRKWQKRSIRKFMVLSMNAMQKQGRSFHSIWMYFISAQPFF